MFANHEGQKVPQVTFHTRRGHKWIDVTTEEVFKGKTVVVFALPGAFTPTCSSTHVPRYHQLAETFKQHGVDEVVCISVNDAFVMNEWQVQQKADNITFLPDGNGDFSRGMGLLVAKNELGFGERSWRYSMLVRDGVIEKMFIEPDVPGDPFEVSDADTMLGYIAPDARKPHNVTVFSREGCPYCARAKRMLNDAGIGFEELVLNRDFSESTLRAVSARLRCRKCSSTLNSSAARKHCKPISPSKRRTPLNRKSSELMRVLRSGLACSTERRESNHCRCPMPAPKVPIRPANQADLETINGVIESAVMTWRLPDRVKRLSLPSYLGLPWFGRVRSISSRGSRGVHRNATTGVVLIPYRTRYSQRERIHSSLRASAYWGGYAL